MKKSNIILLSIIWVLVATIWIILYKQSVKMDNLNIWADRLVDSFYNAKDSTLCLAGVLWEIATRDRCQVYLDQLEKDYIFANEYFDDRSNYIPKE